MFCYQFSEKPGHCPWRRSVVRLCLLRADTCTSDQECPGDNKCCHDGCSRSCSRPISEVKPGTCPKVSQNRPFCDKRGDLCEKDTDCPGSRKCCHNGCQRDCTVPETMRKLKPGVCLKVDAINPKLCKSMKNECKLDGDCYGRLKCCFNGCFNECSSAPTQPPKRGECPFAEYIPPENCSDTTDKCDDDSQCPGRDKCCATGCLQECITPPTKKKPGECPLNDYISPELCEVTEDRCQEDEDCKGRDKCCATGCIKECITPPLPIPTTPEPKKECPKPWKGLNGICDRLGDMCTDDEDCNGSSLCCFNGCQKGCIDPVPTDKPGKCPNPWKGQDGICDRRGDMCTVDIDCEASAKCCFNGCQYDCVKPGKKSVEKPGQCPNPWKEQPCDRRGDMCEEDSDCDSGSKCCHNGCQKDCVKPGKI